jgi:hypothetical protein
MRLKYKLLFVFSLIISIGYSQARVLKGKIVVESLTPMLGVFVMNEEGLVLTTTDFDGNFSVDLLDNSSRLEFNWVGYDSQLVSFSENCSYIEVVMLNGSCYTGISNRRVDRLRKRKHKELPEIYKEAFEKGVFVSKKFCWIQEFIPMKEELDEIKRTRKKPSNQFP